MPAEDLPQYSFLPWSRRGIAARIEQEDHLGKNPGAGPAGRATLTAHLTVESQPVPGAPASGPVSISQEVALVGPGDVGGLKPGTVLREVPTPNSQGATPGELAFVEFYDEDFPWRYTPARATADHRLRPWLSLLVLAAGEFDLIGRPGQLSLLVVADDAPLPPAAETWAWAHVQVAAPVAQDGSNLDPVVSAAPDHALARLASPRRLRPSTQYRAFVVPTFETGRLAGLGTPDGSVKAQRPAWGDGQPRRFPVLHDWAFRTGEVADFESLARKPKPFVAGQSFGKRPMDISDPGAGLVVPDGATAAVEGALQPIGFQRQEFPDSPGTELADDLRDLVDLTEDYRDEGGAPQDDPIVTPPAYGRAHAGLARVAQAQHIAGLGWVAELNMDPRDRAAAGLGAQIVAQRDEELMERAWAQVGAIEAVNQRLREADLAMAVAERLFAKHVVAGDAERLLRVTSAAHSALALHGTTTVRGEVDDSRVPAAAQAPAFRRITRPMSRIAGTVSGGAAQQLNAGLISGLNAEPGTAAAISAAPRVADPAAGVSLDLVVGVAALAAAQQASVLPKPREQFLLLAHAECQARRGSPGGLQPIPETSATTRATFIKAIDDRLVAAFPANPPQPVARLVFETGLVINAVRSLAVPDADTAQIFLDQVSFDAFFGGATDARTYRGVSACRAGAPPQSNATTTDPAAVGAFAAGVAGFAQVAAQLPGDQVNPALTAPTTLASGMIDRLNPGAALPARLRTLVRGAQDELGAEAVATRRLRPVLAHPVFADPLFDPLRSISQDWVLPNIADLPPECIALMEPNTRFIESVLAGASTEMARELLWNEYPTDQRGTYFPRFWDAADSGAQRPPDDIRAIHTWDAPLGGNSGRPGSLLVLVIRAELLVKFPDTIIFAQQARFVGSGSGRSRTLLDTGQVRYPVISGRLDPDIRLYGFQMSPEEAAGSATDAGYFFCFMERPGQVRLGLDLAATPPPLVDWDSLAWTHLAGGDLVEQVVLAGNPLLPSTQGLPAWGATAADMAAILCQNPVFLARHASDMLPATVPPPKTPVRPTS